MFQMVTIARQTTIGAGSGGETGGVGQGCSCPLLVIGWSSAVQPKGRVVQCSVQMRIRSLSRKRGQGVQMFSNFIIALWVKFFFKKSTTHVAIIAKFNGERIIFLTNVAEIITYPCTKRKWTLIHSLYHTKSNSKWITGLMVKSKTVKLLEENIEGDFCGFGLGKEFLSRYQKHHS